MWPLIKDFFTVRSAGVRTVRIVLGALGAAIAAGKVPLGPDWEWVGYVVVVAAGAISQQNGDSD